MRAGEFKSQQRFSDRARDYARYRPSYPPGVLKALVAEGLGEGMAVADIGAGTGIFSRLLLETGATVYAVEPNAPMRCAAELELATRPNYVSFAGSAEATGLEDATVGMVCCAQAFHWFDPVNARAEFARILRRGAPCALVWNRLSSSQALSREFARLEIGYGIDAAEVQSRQAATIAAVPNFFAPFPCRTLVFSHLQMLDWAGLQGRLRSASYMPQPGAPRYDDMIGALKALFAAHESGGTVRLGYETRLFLGSLTPP